MPRFELSKRVKEQLSLYSTILFPIQELTEKHIDLKMVNGWSIPNFYLMFITMKIHKDLKKSIHQYKEIDDVNNVWICKPSYNARGFGIFCFNNPKDVVNNTVKKNPTPKIV